jgi:putative oxidoreductase
MNFLLSAYGIYVKVASLLQPLILLAFRLTWGYQFFKTGKGKLLHHQDIVEFFSSLGIPQPDFNAWFVGGLECVGGILLIIGLASRIIAFPLAISMVVAYLSVAEDRAKLFAVFSNPDPFLQADPFFFLLTALIVLAFGPGPISIDYLLGRLYKKVRPKKKSV